MNKNIKRCKKCGRIIGKSEHICSTGAWNKGLIGFQKGHKPTNIKPNKTSFEKGIVPWNKGTKGIMKAWNKGIKGYKHSEKANNEKSLRMIGEKHFNWQGGKSYEEYGKDWTDDLKESIRKRDNCVCQLCGIHQDELNEKLHCHHIDYDKQNLNPKNLITLCRSCHMKTNFSREYWINYFKKI